MAGRSGAGATISIGHGSRAVSAAVRTTDAVPASVTVRRSVPAIVSTGAASTVDAAGSVPMRSNRMPMSAGTAARIRFANGSDGESAREHQFASRRRRIAEPRNRAMHTVCDGLRSEFLNPERGFAGGGGLSVAGGILNHNRSSCARAPFGASGRSNHQRRRESRNRSGDDRHANCQQQQILEHAAADGGEPRRPNEAERGKCKSLGVAMHQQVDEHRRGGEDDREHAQLDSARSQARSQAGRASRKLRSARAGGVSVTTSAY